MRNMGSSRPHCRTRARRCCKDTCNTFDSGPIAPGQSWKTTIRSAGTIGYHCTQHPNMTATLLVQSVSEKSNQGIVEAPSHPRAGAVSLRWVPPTSPEQFHPILVNFTAALLPLALLSEILGRVFRRRSLHDAALWMVVFAAAITPLTVAAGWWWRHRGRQLAPEVNYDTSMARNICSRTIYHLAVWRWRIQKSDIPPVSAYLASLFVLVLALIYQGSLGGTMAFGR